MSELRHCLCLVVVASLLLACDAGAQTVDTANASDALSQGAEAYAAGNRTQAIALLADAIRRDPHDPRPYYLRALCLARSGRPVAARADLVVAAALEARRPDRYPVADMLSHLAVADRTLLGEYRWHSQTEDFARAFDEGRISFAERQMPVVRTDAGVLRQKATVPLDRLTSDMTLAELANVAAQQPATLAVETGSNPFSDDVAQSAAAAVQPAAHPDADPFGEASPAAQDGSTAATAPHAEPADPFGGSEPAAGGKLSSGKLFGILGRAVARAAPVPSLDSVHDQLQKLPLPAAGNQPPGAVDPFGSAVEPAAFSEQAPATEQPAASEAQPAGEDQQSPAGETDPAAAPEEDPFG